MAASKKKLDPIKQRERRAKIAAGAGCVLLIAIASYEVPATMKMMKHSAPPPPPAHSVTTGSASADGSLPNVASGASTAATASPSSGQFVNSDAPPPSAAGQLVSFSVFETKNPFAPQVSSKTGSTAGSSPATTTGSTPGAGATTTTPTTTTPGATTTTTQTTTSPTPPSVVPPGASPPTSTTPTSTTPFVGPTVAISVNGVVSRVANEGTFPSGAPVFRLVSWTSGSAQVGIVGGSYASGDAALTLHLRQPVTLENQTDGKRYRLELVSTP